MTDSIETAFRSAQPTSVPPGQLTRLPLSQPPDGSAHVACTDGGVVFRTEGWYEILLDVEWDASATGGTRFAHTKIPDQHPLHSEAIDAAVLARISGGRQLLRGNSLFGPDRTTSLVLEVWHDDDEAVEVRAAQLVVRELRVPWQRRDA